MTFVFCPSTLLCHLTNQFEALDLTWVPTVQTNVSKVYFRRTSVSFAAPDSAPLWILALSFQKAGEKTKTIRREQVGSGGAEQMVI